MTEEDRPSYWPYLLKWEKKKLDRLEKELQDIRAARNKIIARGVERRWRRLKKAREYREKFIIRE